MSNSAPQPFGIYSPTTLNAIRTDQQVNSIEPPLQFRPGPVSPTAHLDWFTPGGQDAYVNNQWRRWGDNIPEPTPESNFKQDAREFDYNLPVGVMDNRMMQQNLERMYPEAADRPAFPWADLWSAIKTGFWEHMSPNRPMGRKW
jgi:hypothetical protein